MNKLHSFDIKRTGPGYNHKIIGDFILVICSSSLCTCLHHMVILRTQNKITDFFMILAWASPFKTHIFIYRLIYGTDKQMCYVRNVVLLVIYIILIRFKNITR